MPSELYFHAPCWLCVRAGAAGHDTIFDFVLVGVALVLLPVRSVVTGRKLARAELSQTGLLRRYVSILVQGIAIAVCVIGVWEWIGRSFELLGLGALTDAGSKVGFAIDGVLLAALVVEHLRLGKFSRQKVAQLQERMKSNKIIPRNVAEFSVFCAVAVTAGIWEELLFRGFLIWFFIPVVGIVGAIVCSAIFFGLGHAYQGWRNMVRTGLVGAAIAIFYVATRSLWWLIGAHAMMDILGGLFGLRLAMLSARTEDTAG
jgi:membrane protease YdiL (CAAX protease family)